MDKLCLRCSSLQSCIRNIRNSNIIFRKPQYFVLPSVSSRRHYAVKERSSEQIYKHGKLIVEEEEDFLLYPKVLITLSSTDEAVVEHFSHFVKKTAKMTDVDVTKSFSMPAVEEHYKARREGEGVKKEVEYHFKRYQRVIEISDLTAEKSDLFLEFTQQSLPPGVNMKLEAGTTTQTLRVGFWQPGKLTKLKNCQYEFIKYIYFMMDRSLNSEERQVCWTSRDKYFECLEQNSSDNKSCKELYKTFEESCPKRWVKYFASKRRKDMLTKKLENEGAQYLDGKT